MKNHYRIRQLFKRKQFLILRLWLIILISSLGLSPAFCQEITTLDRAIQSIYGMGGFNYAFQEEFLPVHAGGGIVFKSDWGVEFIFTAQNFEANNKPDDYDGGLCIFSPCVSRGINSWSFPVNRSFTTTDKILRLTLGLGPALFIYQEPQYEKRPPTGGIFNFSSNYDVNYKKHYLPGLYGKVRADFLPFKYVGLGFGFSAKVNSEISYVSLDVDLLLGILRTSPRKLISL